MDRVESSVSGNVNSFWSLVNSKRRSPGIPSNVYLHQSTASSYSTGAELFASFFGSVYTPASAVAPALNAVSDCDVNQHELNIPISEIYSKLNSLDVSKGLGFDGIPPLFLKNCCFILGRPLWHIFNLSLGCGCFPALWKTSLVTPVFKAGDRVDVRNYRPICKLSTLPKVFEEIVTEQLTPCLTNVICDEQHGFIPQRSTVTNLAVYHCAVSAALDEGLQVDTVYTDFSKAFDSVDHQILLHKLAAYTFRGPLLSWIGSYLADRVQVISVENRLFTPVTVCSGVPQGSHLGPLLFVLFINDLKDVFRNSRVLMYADDLKIFRTISNGQDVELLQDDLGRFELWCNANMMSLNIAKCVLVRAHRSVRGITSAYTLCDAPLIEVADDSDLEVIIAAGPDFRKHYQNLTRKAMKTLGFIARFAKHFKRLKS